VALRAYCLRHLELHRLRRLHSLPHQRLRRDCRPLPQRVPAAASHQPAVTQASLARVCHGLALSPRLLVAAHCRRATSARSPGQQSRLSTAKVRYFMRSKIYNFSCTYTCNDFFVNVCCSQPQYGAVVCAVVAVNVPIVFIIVYFTAILISLRRQLGKHHQAHKHQPSASLSVTLPSPARACGDGVRTGNSHWDSDEVQAIEMADLVSQSQPTASFYLEPEDSMNISSNAADHRLCSINNNTYIEPSLSNGNADTRSSSDGNAAIASGMLRRLLANHRLTGGTPCQRRAQRGYMRASTDACLDDDSDDSEDDGSEERIRIVRLCTEEIMERRALSSGVQVTYPGSTSVSAYNDVLRPSPSSAKRTSPNHAYSLSAVQQLNHSILSEEDEEDDEDGKSELSATPLSRCASQRVVAALALVPRSSLNTSRPLHMCNSEPAVSSLYRRVIVGDWPAVSGRLSDTTTNRLLHQQGSVGRMSPAGRLRSASQPVASFSKALWGRRRRDSMEKARVRQQARAAVTLGVITLCMLCCWLPFSVVWPWRIFCPSCVPNYVYDLATWVNYANSAINPCIYCLTNPLYRQAFRRIFVRFLCRRHREYTCTARQMSCLHAQHSLVGIYSR
jgi:hypothetical protein